MGLLGDSWDDPKTQATLMMAAGLMGGGGFGQALGRGIQGYSEVLSKDAERQAQKAYREAQVEQLKSQAAENRMKVEQQQSMQGLLGSIFSPKQTPQAQAGDAYMPGAPSAGLTSPGGLENATPDQIAMLKARGVDLSSIWEKAKTGLVQDAGKWYMNPLTNQREYIADPTKGLGVSGGQVVGLPGFTQANAAIKGAEAEAVEGAKARFDPVQVRGNDGAMELRPRSQVVGQQPVQQGFAGLTPNQRQMIQADISKNGNPNPTIAPNWDYGQQQPQRFAVTPTDADRVAQEAALVAARDGAAAGVKRETTQKDESKRYGQFSEASNRAIDLLKQGPTGSGFGSLVDSGAAFFGKSTKGAEVSEQLKTVAGWLVSNVPRMEGPQSNVDVMNYQVMAGNVGNEKLPVEQRLAAAQEVKRLQDKYAALNGGSVQTQSSQDAVPLPPNPSAQSLKPGTVYDTPKGLAEWDGFRFKKVQ